MQFPILRLIACFSRPIGFSLCISIPFPFCFHSVSLLLDLDLDLATVVGTVNVKAFEIFYHQASNIGGRAGYIPSHSPGENLNCCWLTLLFNIGVMSVMVLFRL